MTQFIIPKRLSPFYSFKRVPRKLKKKWRFIFKNPTLDINQKMWYLLEFTNPKYKQFIINEIVKRHEQNSKNIQMESNSISL